MSRPVNQQLQLVARPRGEPSAADFRLVEAPLPALADGQVLVRHHWLSLDPYMRGRMSDAASYAAPQPLGEVMIGGTAGEVLESRHPDFRPGDAVVSTGGWQLYQVVDAARRGVLRKVDTGVAPLQAYLGVLGMPGITAWYGVTQLLDPQRGQTLVVSAASGAVGSVVGQLARERGARAVGIAGGPAKCAWVREGLGFDDCVDHRAHAGTDALAAALRAACPDGIDRDFENVGGVVLDAVLRNANAFARIALCGMVAGYNGAPVPLQHAHRLLTQRMRLEGFIVSEHMALWPQAVRELGELHAAGRLRYRESVVEGLAAAPAALAGLLRGENFGKQLVKLT